MRDLVSVGLLAVASTVAVAAAGWADGRPAARQYVREGGSWMQVDPDGSRYEIDPRVITVKFREGVSRASQQALHASLGAVELRRAITGFADVEVAAGQDVFAAIDAYLASGLVEIAEPNTFGRYQIEPDDPMYPSQWHLPKVMAPEAWDSVTGDPLAIIAVLDSGTEFTHEDLGTGADAYQNIWLNDGEDAWSDPDDPSTGNGVDDDSNGFIDDWKGWDFGNGNNDPSGPFFHGTAVAGVAAAKTHNVTGVAGAAGGWNGPGARIMIGGVGDAAPNGAVLDDAILYAGAMGAHVIQLSLAVGQSAAIDAAVQAARDVYDMSVICSSGNGGQDMVSYPASNPDVMAIGATTQDDLKADFSNHGPDLEISAPGVDIVTTDTGDGYTTTGGTSFSSPLVSGVVALMLATVPNLSNEAIRQILKDTADKVGGYDYNWNPAMPGHSFELGYGRLNAENAIAGALVIFTDGFESGDVSSWSSSAP